jgi:hypothetical protein
MWGVRSSGSILATFRPRAALFVVYVFQLAVTAMLASLLVLVFEGRKSHLYWPVVGALFVVLMLPLGRVRCVVTDEGLAIQNYVRSYWLSWREMKEVALMPQRALSVGLMPQSVPECVTQTGRRVTAAALRGASVPAGDRFQSLVEAKAEAFGFTASVAWGYAAR